MYRLAAAILLELAADFISCSWCLAYQSALSVDNSQDFWTFRFSVWRGPAKIPKCRRINVSFVKRVPDSVAARTNSHWGRRAWQFPCVDLPSLSFILPFLLSLSPLTHASLGAASVSFSPVLLLIISWAHRSKPSKMSSTQSATLILQRESPPRKSMIPISTISRLWKPSKEPDTSSAGSSKTPRRVTRSPNNKEQRVLPNEANAIYRIDDPFTADKSPRRAALSKIPSRADVEKRTDESHSKASNPVQPPKVAPISPHVVVGKRCDSLLSIPEEPIFLGEDFAALLKVANIRNKESIWVDLWVPIRAGDKVIPLDAQYLSSLKSFLGLRYLKVTGMLKSYQKEIFRAVWKMESLEHLDLRMAEEPQLSPGVYWRRIEKGWVPRRREPQDYKCP